MARLGRDRTYQAPRTRVRHSPQNVLRRRPRSHDHTGVSGQRRRDTTDHESTSAPAIPGLFAGPGRRLGKLARLVPGSTAGVNRHARGPNPIILGKGAVPGVSQGVE